MLDGQDSHPSPTPDGAPASHAAETNSAPSPQQLLGQFRGVASIVLAFVLLYAIVGTLTHPAWWHGFLFEGGVFTSEYWNEGFGYVGSHYFVPFLLIMVLMVFVYLLISLSMRMKIASIWKSVKKAMSGRTGVYVHIMLIAALAIALWATRASSENERLMLMELAAARERTAKDSLDHLHNSDREPLTEPTSFLFLSKENIDSLYGQYEPDLIPSSIIEEIKKSRDFKGSVGIEDFLKSEAGKNELQSRLTEYRQSTKNTERKTKDLLRYLLEKSAVKRYKNIATTSDDIKKLDESIEFLKSNYDLSVDLKQLTIVRDRLLSKEIQRLMAELKDLHGLVLIEGDWIIETQSDVYSLRRPFVDNITDSPFSEAKIRKSDISAQNKEMIESLKGQRMRLSLFGNVITGMSGDSRTVRVNPFALF